MFVACSMLCFSRMELEAALRQMAEFEISKYELALVEDGPGLRPSDLVNDFEAVMHRMRAAPSLTPSSILIEPGAVDFPTLKKQFDAVCKFAKQLTVAVITLPAASANSSFDEEVARLGELTDMAHREGLVLSVMTHADSLAGEPSSAEALCQAVPGLGLTLDPSHYIYGPLQNANYDNLFPYVQNVHLRDTGRKSGEFQVRVGQGLVEYGRIVSQLERYGYSRALTIAILDSLENPFEVEVEVRKMKLLLESLL